jgi:N-acyl-D-aspartate/D-glutamate deacylase
MRAVSFQLPATSLRVLAACVLFAFCAFASASAQTAEYDIVVRNGRVFDGGGNPWIRADVAIKNGRVARIGLIPGKGAKEIDAAGRYVSPGWIDMMDQSASVLTRNGLAENKVMMGVTTALSGEGGFPVPLAKASEWYAGLEKSGISLNFGDYYSATDARRAVLGMQDRAPTPAELERMKAMVDSAMRAGAFGITTALIYPPSSFHRTEELIDLAKVASKYGGFYASHIRGEGKELVQSVTEAIRIGEEGGVPVEIYHLKAAYQPGWGTLMGEVGTVVDAARGRGVDVAADLYPYTAGEPASRRRFPRGRSPEDTTRSAFG